ncbi:MAG: nickel-dependent lactate racemase [Nitrospinota bacterium]|nr:MAG: nickel-dependent lactate racemase [Nitrospinota bacterium]
MEVALAYGKGRLHVELPEQNLAYVIHPPALPPLPNPAEQLRASLASPLQSEPLRELAGQSKRIVLVIADITRPVPYRTLLPVLLTELSVPPERLTILVATGLHRPNSPAELAEMLGDDVVQRYRIVNHNAHDPRQLRRVGTSSRGTEVFLNRLYLEADLRIAVGHIEPHFFAGFCGGPKFVMPGVAGAATIRANHGARNIDHPGARYGVLQGNPIHEEIREIALMAPPEFMVNVTLDREKRITGIFSGALLASYEAGVEFLRETAMVTVEEPVDIVITTNSGYPLDMNLYQTVKGVAVAEEILREPGTIIVASECSEGVGHGMFQKLLQESSSPQELLQKIRSVPFYGDDQWQVQILARILEKSTVFLYSDTLSPEEIRACHFRPTPGIAEAVQQALADHGPRARIGVVPDGPLTVPYLKERVKPTPKG